MSRSIDMSIFDEHQEFRQLKFFYRNWKGECGYRTVKGLPLFWYGQSEYHKGEQWFIKAYDVEKEAIRDFALLDIIEFIK